MNYYNDNNPHSVAWIKALIEDGLIPKGVVDERSITDVVPADLAGFDQCHFFAGIAGWPLALGLAGWPADQPVWTASCPCQPFSIAGTGKGTSDRRHLFPELRRLMEACRPSITFGEQVASAAGREWLAGVFNDLEEIGYEVAGADLCASGVSSPQVRQRICWMAHRNDEGRERWVCRREDQEWEDLNGHAGCDCVSGSRMASAGCDVTECTEGKGQRSGDQSGTGASDKPDRCRPARPWDNSVWIECRDNKARRIPSGSQSFFQCLADGIPKGVDIIGLASLGFPLAPKIKGRVGLLQGIGNSIVPELLSEFILAGVDAL